MTIEPARLLQGLELAESSFVLDAYESTTHLIGHTCGLARGMCGVDGLTVPVCLRCAPRGLEVCQEDGGDGEDVATIEELPGVVDKGMVLPLFGRHLDTHL